MGRTISITTLMGNKYKTYGFDQYLIDIIGDAEIGFSALIWGASGHGKSTFVALLCKQLSKHGKVYYNSIEQGEGKTIQDLARHTNLLECGANFTIGDKDTFDEMYAKLKVNRARFVVIDSLQYINLTVSQYKQLTNDFKNKAFLIISWEGNGGNPKGEAGKAIRYMCDIKIYVKMGKADIASRFGSTEPFKIPGIYEKFQKAIQADKEQKKGTLKPNQPTLFQNTSSIPDATEAV